MRDANEAIQPIHNRMPVILNPEDYETWLYGSFDDAVALQQRVYPSDVITIDRTSEPWTKRKSKPEEQTAALM
jgi:putative SOS response-associated peptidase YedK